VGTRDASLQDPQSGSVDSCERCQLNMTRALSMNATVTIYFISFFANQLLQGPMAGPSDVKPQGPMAGPSDVKAPKPGIPLTTGTTERISHV
jgi:hypothetical protein